MSERCGNAIYDTVHKGMPLKGHCTLEKGHDRSTPCTYKAQATVAHADAVHHPSHYGGQDNPYEAIKVIEAWELNFSLGNAVKYIARAGKKAGESDVKDLEKAASYLAFEIARRKRAGGAQ